MVYSQIEVIMQAGIYLGMAMIFLLGWWTERQQRIRAEKKIDQFYGN